MKCIRCNAELPDDAIYCHICGKKQSGPKEKRKALKRANGAGTVYKLQGRRSHPWVAAKNKIIIGYYEKKSDAMEALEHMAAKPITARYNMTFADVYVEWKNEHFKALTKAVQLAYEHSYNECESIHDRKFRDLRTADFQSVIDQHREKPEAVKKHKQLLNQMARWAMREEIVTQNFAQFVALPSTAQKKEKEVFSDEEIEKIRCEGSEAARIILMLLSTGMRVGELFSLPLADYHETYVIGGSKTAAGRNRVIPIRPDGREHFAYFAQRANGDLLLSGYSGNKDVLNFRRREYYKLLDKLGIDRKSPHATRHTFTSWAVKSGMAPEVLQQILGHADYSTTANIYTHIDAKTLVEAVEKC